MQEDRVFNRMLRDRPLAIVVVTLVALLFGMGVGAGLGNAMAQAMGVNVSDIMSWTEPHPLEFHERQGIRWFNLIAHFFTFTFVALVIAFLAKDQRGAFYFLQFRKRLKGFDLGLGVLLLLCSFPLIMFSNWLNSILPLPESLITLENNQNWLVGEVLRMENPGELLMALLVAAVAPAVGEELLFRGVLQPRVQQATASVHLGIWITAALFSAIHLQFVGFLPRMLLGALLGYLLLWSGTLWLPIIAHFLFNATQIFGAYWNPDMFTTAMETEKIESPAWWLVLLSAAAITYLIRSWLNRGVASSPDDGSTAW